MPTDSGQMPETDLIAIINSLVDDAEAGHTTMHRKNNQWLKEYLGEPYGNEVPGRSSVVSRDIFDTIESEKPSLLRVFMGGPAPIRFTPTVKSQESEEEADQKNKYIDWIIRRQPGSFETISGWITDAEIHSHGVVKYFVERTNAVEYHSYKGLNPDEVGILTADLESSPGVMSVDIINNTDEEGETSDVDFKVLIERQKIVVKNVAPENFLITSDAASVDEAIIVGDVVRKTRGELVAEGYDKDLVMSLPSDTVESRFNGGALDEYSSRDRYGHEVESAPHWTIENVELYDLYVLVDFDGDGVPERRHILKCANELLVNEPFAHVPYAVMSATMMPHRVIGMGRSEVLSTTQKIKTAITRQMIDNIYRVNNPRPAVNDRVNLDDLLDDVPGGIIQCDGDEPVGNNILPIVTPYIGDQTLQIIQYIDQTRAQSTGQLLASQGLSADDLGKETATRFKGVEQAAKGKIELIARNFAETGFRKLYDGVLWLVEHYHDEGMEQSVLGEELTVRVSEWRHPHHTDTRVGLGNSDSEKLIATMTGVLQVQQGLASTGSPLVDNEKIYNTISRLLEASEVKNPETLINNPEIPEEVLMAENEQLKAALAQMQQILQQQANPLAEAENIKAQAKLIEAQSRQDIEAARIREQQRQFDLETTLKSQEAQAKLLSDMQKHNDQLALKLTELEAKLGRQLDQDIESNKETVSDA